MASQPSSPIVCATLWTCAGTMSSAVDNKNGVGRKDPNSSLADAIGKDQGKKTCYPFKITFNRLKVIGNQFCVTTSDLDGAFALGIIKDEASLLAFQATVRNIEHASIPSH